MALGFGALFADFKAENRAASMGPRAFSIFSRHQAPTYKMMRHWLVGGNLRQEEIILFTAWLLAIIMFSLVIGLSVEEGYGNSLCCTNEFFLCNTVQHSNGYFYSNISQDVVREKFGCYNNESRFVLCSNE